MRATLQLGWPRQRPLTKDSSDRRVAQPLAVYAPHVPAALVRQPGRPAVGRRQTRLPWHGAAPGGARAGGRVGGRGRRTQPAQSQAAVAAPLGR